MKRSRLAGWVLLVVVAAGCSSAPALVRPGFSRPAARPFRVLLMPADVELTDFTAGGEFPSRPEWSEQARRHAAVALREELDGRGALAIDYQRPAGDPEQEAADEQLMLLHGAVAAAIRAHAFDPTLALPTKQGRFDWALGPGIRRLHERTGADHAVFVRLRGSYSTPGRVALLISAALVGKAGVGSFGQASASLVDLRTGDIVWFNGLANPSGHLKEIEPVRRAIARLLADLPL